MVKKMKNSRQISRIFTAAMAVLTCAAVFSSCGKDDKIPVIGINQLGQHGSLDNCREGFLAGLEEARLKEGTDFTVDYQNGGFDDNIISQISSTFASKNVDYMVGIATNSAISCYNAAEEKNIPVVFIAVSDPEAANLTTGNVTGTSDKLPVDAQLELIRKMQPDASTIGIIYTTSEPNSVSTIADYQEKAGNYGFTIDAVGVTSQAEVTQAADTLISRGVDCFSNLTDNNVVGVLDSILEKTNEAGIPIYGSEIEQVQKGCAASAGIDYIELGKRTGKMTAKLIKGEATASEMPYETITDYKVYINTEVCNTLSVAIPSDIAETAIEASEAE